MGNIVDMSAAGDLAMRTTSGKMVFNRALALLTYAAELKGWSVGKVLTKTRLPEYTRTRYAIVKVMRDDMHFSLKRIAFEMGWKDHTTILNALKRAEMLYGTNEEFTAFTDKLREYVLQREAA